MILLQFGTFFMIFSFYLVQKKILRRNFFDPYPLYIVQYQNLKTPSPPKKVRRGPGEPGGPGGAEGPGGPGDLFGPGGSGGPVAPQYLAGQLTLF